MRSSSKETEAVFSPDTHWLAYISSNTGNNEAYVQALALSPQPQFSGNPVRISTEGASLIRWRADGKEMYFLDPDNWVSAVSIEARKGQLLTGTPVRLFKLKSPTDSGSVTTGFDVSYDGQKFLIANPVAINDPSIVVVQNWQFPLK